MVRTIIKLENVSKKYIMGDEEFYALKDINIEVFENDFVVILGPSGSGKSTLLHILGLLDAPSEGNVYFHGKNIKDYTSNELAEKRFKNLGFVFQSFNLIQTLSALQNVMLPLMFYDYSGDQMKSKANSLLVRLGLSEKLNNLPSELSGGQQQRVSVARSLVNDPDILLADEPTGNLDTKSGEEVLKILKEINDEGKTVLLITHDPLIATRSFVNKIYYIEDGMVKEVNATKFRSGKIKLR